LFATRKNLRSGAEEHKSEREWHRSQEILEREDGSLLVRLCVCDDRPLRSWNHSLGPMARVSSPAKLAQELFDEIEQTRERYQPRFTFEMRRMATSTSQQPALPLRAERSKAS
jgi:hypothetical protein